MTGRWPVGLVAVALALPAQARSESVASVPVLSDKATWNILPPAEENPNKPLPVWVRALAGTLPRTAAAMLELDYAQRAESPLPARLRAKLRWVAARANRSPYAQAYAKADYLRAGGKQADLDSLDLTKLPEAERLALVFVRQLCEAAYSVTDAQVARLVKLYGEKETVAIVLLAAYANFQDRLLLALGVRVEDGGPYPPLRVRFKEAAAGGKEPADRSKRFKRKASLPAKELPAIPTRVDDPEWASVSYETLRGRLNQQVKRPRARVAIPDWKAVLAGWPEDLPRPGSPTRIRWSLLTSGYQPRLSAKWGAGLRAFHQDSDLDAVFHESMFWVVTRSLQCFY